MIETCPVCDYSLRGLPPAHRCPECGFGYDQDTRVWCVSRRGRGFLVPAILLPFWVREIITSSAADLRFWFFLAATLSCAAFIVRRYVPGRSPFVATTPAGIVARLNSSEPLFIPWSHVKGVALKQAAGRAFVRLVCGSDATTIDLSPAIRDPDDAVAFTALVRQRSRSTA